jgi:hypothetical protein
MNNFHCLLPEEKYTMTSQTSFDDREIEFVIKTQQITWVGTPATFATSLKRKAVTVLVA